MIVYQIRRENFLSLGKILALIGIKYIYKTMHFNKIVTFTLGRL